MSSFPFRFVCALSIIFFTYLASSSTVSKPVVTNSSGEYFIASKKGLFTTYSGNTIECTNPDSCHIICDKDKSCKGSKVSASASTSLSIQCTKGHSCSGMELVDPPTDSITINCFGDVSCADAVFKFDTTTNASVDCSGSTPIHYGHEPLSACNRTKFYGMQTVNTHVRCAGADCHYSTFHLNESETATFIMDRPYSTHTPWEQYISNVAIYGPHITKSLTVQCIEPILCIDNVVVCPSEADCIFALEQECWMGNRCMEFDIWVKDNDYSHLYMAKNNTLDWPLDWQQELHVEGNYHCMDTGDVVIKRGSDNYKRPDCRNYGRDGNCCPAWHKLRGGSIDCVEGAECEIDCSQESGGCSDKQINGTSAKSLTVKCGDASNCYKANILCPISGGFACNILCDGESSCKNSTVNVYDLDILNISCTANSACVGMEVWALEFNASSINTLALECSERSSCENMIFGYGTSVGTMSLQCLEHRSCYNMRLPRAYHFARVATTITTSLELNCAGNNSCKDMEGHIIGGASSKNHIICNNPIESNMANESSACYHAMFVLSSNENTGDFYVSCNKNDCQEISIKTGPIVSLSVDCYGEKSCSKASISAVYGTLHLKCSGDSSCRDAGVTPPYDTAGAANILCGAADNVCSNMSIQSAVYFVEDSLNLTCSSPEQYTSPCDDIKIDCEPIYGTVYGGGVYRTTVYVEPNPVSHSYDGCYSYDGELVHDIEQYCCPLDVTTLNVGGTASISTTKTGVTGSISTTKSGSISTTKRGSISTTKSGSISTTKSGSISTTKSGSIQEPEPRGNDDDRAKSSGNNGVILGVVFGLLGAVLLGVILWFVLLRNKKRSSALLLHDNEEDAEDAEIGTGDNQEYIPPRTEQEMTTV